MIKLKNLWHSYATRQPNAANDGTAALRGVNLEIAAGEYVALIGANGSGKSTLARHLNALLLPSQGEVSVAGIDTRQAAEHAALRRIVQMVFQQPDQQIVATTVEEDVAFGLENFAVPPAEMPGRISAALEIAGLIDQRSRPPHMLSAGQKQRLAIAAALALQPQVLVFDEATAMLDPNGRADVLAIIEQLHQNGATIITITHHMEEAALARRVIVLEQGQVALDGEPRQVFAQAERLRQLQLDIPALAAISSQLRLPVCLTSAELIHSLGAPPAMPVRSAGEVEATPPASPTANAASAIEVHNLSHTYLRGTPLQTHSLHEISFQVARGAALGLIGQTGSGKSTLMQHLNGLLHPQSGQVIVNGHDWSDPQLAARTARLKVGLLFQQPEDQLFEQYVGDDIAFGPRQLGLPPGEVRQRVQAAMEAVGLPFETFKDRLTTTLSGGEQRRAALAGVLALQPEMLVADEPGMGLDPQGRQRMMDILRQAQRAGMTLVISAHHLEDIAELCDPVLVLKAGRTARFGATRQVLGDAQALAAHGMPAAPAAQISAELRAAGWNLPDGIITLDELILALQRLRQAAPLES